MKKIFYYLTLAMVIAVLSIVTGNFVQAKDLKQAGFGAKAGSPLEIPNPSKNTGTISGSPLEIPNPPKNPGTVSGSPLEIPNPPKNPGPVSGSPLEIPNPPKISLRAHNGMYVVSEGGGGKRVLANRKAAHQWATFMLTDINGGQLISGDNIFLRGFSSSYYLSVANGNLSVTSLQAGNAETFTIYKLRGSNGKAIEFGDKITLKSYRGKFVVAEGGGGKIVNANRTKADRWETFTLMRSPFQALR